MKKCILFLFLLSITFSFVYTQDTTSVKYFPLSVGNTWIYSSEAVIGGMGCLSFKYYQKVNIDSSKIFHGKTYFKFNVENKHISGQGNCYNTLFENRAWYRVDSLNGNIYKYMPGFVDCPLTLYEGLVDSLKSRIGDTSYFCQGGIYQPYRRHSDTSRHPFQNLMLRSKGFYGPATGLDYFKSNTYSENFGVVRYGSMGPGIYTNSLLKGCIINGVTLGDTSFSVIGINQISSLVPGEFKLFQNYPNPFNPTTQISFDIPKASFVEVIIYDASGKEIEKLVSENLSVGSYSADWNASAYPSGVYFYKITAGEFRESKKMVIVK